MLFNPCTFEGPTLSIPPTQFKFFIMQLLPLALSSCLMYLLQLFSAYQNMTPANICLFQRLNFSFYTNHLQNGIALQIFPLLFPNNLSTLKPFLFFVHCVSHFPHLVHFHVNYMQAGFVFSIHSFPSSHFFSEKFVDRSVF